MKRVFPHTCDDRQITNSLYGGILILGVSTRQRQWKKAPITVVRKQKPLPFNRLDGGTPTPLNPVHARTQCAEV
jgi:hypothetical protein